MSTLKRRIIAGVGANAFGQAISTLIQLTSLPLFLSHWDITQYGIWLILSSIPSYFSMADGGIVNAARNEMTMALGRKDATYANTVFQSTLVFLLSISLLLLVLVSVVVFVTPIGNFFEHDYALIFFLLVTGIFLSFINGLSEATFCSVGKYGQGTAMGHLIRLAEWLGGIVGLLSFGSFLSVAIGMLLMRGIGVVVSIALSQQYASVFIWGFRFARLEQFKATIKPALFFLIFPLSSALSIQGFTLLIGSVLGAASVAVFTTYRTLARVIVQITSVLSFSVGPELSRLFGAKEYQQYLALFRRSQLTSVALVVATSAVVAVIGPWILQGWTHGRIEYVAGLFWSMLLYATVVGISHVPKILLMSINRHSTIAIASVVVYSLSLLVAYLMGARLNLTGNILIMTASEFCLMLLTLYLARVEIRQPHIILATGC